MVGFDEIRAAMTKQFRMPGFKITWKPTRTEFPGKGDVGFAVGCYEVRFAGDDDEPVIENGTYLTTWQHSGFRTRSAFFEAYLMTNY